MWRRRPLYYYSSTARLFGAGDVVPVPATERLDCELELAAVIGRETSDVAAHEAIDAIVGFTLFNDWSARDLQVDEMAYGLGPSKGKDFGSSLGPCLVTTDELAPYLIDGRLDLACRVRANGETWAESSSAAMFHSWPAMVEHAALGGRLLPWGRPQQWDGRRLLDRRGAAQGRGRRALPGAGRPGRVRGRCARDAGEPDR